MDAVPENVPDNVPDAELRVLEVLWEQTPATIRQISDKLYPGGRLSKRATVLKLLERLEAKRLVSRERSGTAQRFDVLVDRDALIGNQLRRIADRLSGSSFAPLLAHLVQSATLTDKERRQLRKLLDTPQAEAPRPRGGKRSAKSRSQEKS